jgi:hypothetical protein
MTAAAKNVTWNRGSEDFVAVLDGVFVKMAYREKSRLNISKTHYLEVTKYVVSPVEFNWKGATIVCLSKSDAAVSEQVQDIHHVRGEIREPDPVH